MDVMSRLAAIAKECREMNRGGYMTIYYDFDGLSINVDKAFFMKHIGSSDFTVEEYGDSTFRRLATYIEGVKIYCLDYKEDETVDDVTEALEEENDG